MTDRDKKTIRIAAAGIAIYLTLFFGFKLWKSGQRGANDYQTLVRRAEKLQSDLRAQETKVFLFEKLTNIYQLDPRKIKSETLVADASAAIQNAARSGGMQLGPLREAPGRPNARELSTIQLEGSGPVPAALGLLHRLQTLGYPLLIESVQFGPSQGRPGQVKLNVTVIILNYDQFKEAPNA